MHCVAGAVIVMMPPPEEHENDNFLGGTALATSHKYRIWMEKVSKNNGDSK